METLYRVEHTETGLGPFQHLEQQYSKCLYEIIEDLCTNLVTYPGIQEETVVSKRDLKIYKQVVQDMTDAYFDLNVDRPWLFSFSSMQELYSWFHDGCLTKLKKVGFKVIVLETDRSNVLRLSRQSVILNKDLIKRRNNEHCK